MNVEINHVSNYLEKHMKLVILNCMDALLIQQDVLLFKHVKIMTMNNHV